MQFNQKQSNSPRKVKKALYTASGAARYRMMSSPLSKDLKAELKVSRVPVREGDEVVIVSGKHRSATGTIAKVCRATLKVTVKGVSIENRKGLPVPVPLSPCKLRVTKLYMNKFREQLIKRRAKE